MTKPLKEYNVTMTIEVVAIAESKKEAIATAKEWVEDIARDTKILEVEELVE